MERFKLIVSVYLFLVKDGKILLQLRENTGYFDNFYGPPAGHLEDNESIREGLIREVKEEIDIDIKPSDMTFVHAMHRKEKDTRADFFFTAEKYKGIIKNAEPHKHAEVEWVSLDNLPENTIPYIREAIQNWQSGIIYSELGF